MVDFKKLTYRAKALLFSTVFAALVVIVSVCLIVFGSRRVFNSQTDSYLLKTSDLKALRFESELGKQLVLVTQMVKSPAIIEYMENPRDASARNSAFDEFRNYKSSFWGDSVFWISDSDKVFYSDMQSVYVLDPADPQQYWYNMTLTETEVYNFNINYNPDLKNSFLWINAVVRNDRGKAVGIAGTGIPLNGLFDSLFVGLGKKDALYLYNSAGEITGSIDQNHIESKIPVTALLPELEGQELTHSEPFVYSTSRGEYMLYPVETLKWMMVMFRPYTLSDVFTNSLALMVLLLVLITGISIAVYSIFIHRIIVSLSSVIKSTEESAALQDTFTKSVKKTVDTNLKALENYGELLDSQTASIEESESHIETLLTQLGVLDNVRRSSLANAKALEESSSDGQEHIAHLRDNISQIVECSKRLVAANGLISDVTTQTDLLALNAAIEAAHAGELGAGFAVVARAIRQLAEKSHDQELNVEKAIEDMNIMIESMVESAEAVSSSFEEIVENSANVNANFEEMSESIEEQNALGNTIDTNLHSITESVNKSSSSFDEMMVSNKAMGAEIARAAENSQSLLMKAEEALESTGVVFDDIEDDTDNDMAESEIKTA